MSGGTTARPSLTRKVGEAVPKDVGRALVRLDPNDLSALGIASGDIVEIIGKRCTVAKAMPAFPTQRGQGRAHIDGQSRQNADVSLDQQIVLRPCVCKPADRVSLCRLDGTHRAVDPRLPASHLDGLPVVVGDVVSVPLFGRRPVSFRVTAVTPIGPVLLTPETVLEVDHTPGKETAREGGALSYEEIGGLKREIGLIREMIELPLRCPEVFERLGIDAPKGVLLYGPPGCGKTLIARTVAKEAGCYFRHLAGPEIMAKMYGESEANLRAVFEDAQKRAPAIIFIDEIDAIAPRREEMGGERQIERRVVAQLLTLMDGMKSRGNVVVIAATNLPNSIDPALRRPGRFDREIFIRVPDQLGRRQILDVHSRGMPLSDDVDLDELARLTHGFVGADLQALCREAAMLCLRRILPSLNLDKGEIPEHLLRDLEVHQDDFRTALRSIEPSALREVFVEVPQVKWEEVAGLESVKEQLIEAVEWPLRYPEVFRRLAVRPPKGVLLCGPPGCGKTFLAKAAASRLEVNFISVKGPTLLSKYVGESERAVRDLFARARQAAPCIVFFDELDALVPARGGADDSQTTNRVIAQFLAEMDGVEELNGVLILGATNRRDILDPALLRPGRFDLVVEIPLPDLAGRKEIFRINLHRRLLDSSVDLDALAARTDGFSGAEIAAVCTQAALGAIRDGVRRAENDPQRIPAQLPLSAVHFEAALESVRPGRGEFRV